MIETKDLILRQGMDADWKDLYRNLWSREEVFRYLFSRPSPNEEAGQKRTAAYAQMHQEVKNGVFRLGKGSKADDRYCWDQGTNTRVLDSHRYRYRPGFLQKRLWKAEHYGAAAPCL